MALFDSRLNELAAAVSDGSGVDWRGAEAKAASDEDREFVRCLRLVERIADVHSSASWVAGGSVATSFSDEAPVAWGAMPAPTHWGPLTIGERIGSGTFGDVYRAWDKRLDREVALKLLRPRAGAVPASADQLETAFVEEGRLMARVRHPGVATVFGAERVDGRAGFWMELVRGRTLEQELAERGPLPADEISRIGVAVCEALAAVHRAGLVHRDIKAQNVMRDADGRIVLMDFGTGLEIADETQPTRLAGTPLYLAPEVLDGTAPTPQSDLYSVAILLYHLATASFPTPGRTLREVRQAHRRGQRHPLTTARPDLPTRLAAAVDHALAPDAALRFTDAPAMRDAVSVLAPETGRSRTLWIRGTLAAALAAIGWFSGWGATEVPLQPHDPVLIAAFENRTGDPFFDGTVEQALERELASSSHVSIIPRGRVDDALRLMQKPLDTKIDTALGRDLALRDGGVRAVISGRVEKVSAGYMVSAVATRPEDGAIVAAVDETAPAQSDLPRAIRRASLTLRTRLGENRTAVEASRRQLEKVTTPSWHALQLYSQAAALVRFDGLSDNAPLAEQLLREALKDDPEFASAHMLLAFAIHQQETRMPEVLQHADRALQLADQTTQIERLFIIGTHHQFHGLAAQHAAEWERLYAQAAVAYEALLRLQPDHYWALDRLTLTYSNLFRAADSARLAQRLAAVRPNSGAWLAWAAVEHVRAGAYEDALRLGSEASERMNPGENPNIGATVLLPAQIAWLKNDVWGALRATDAVFAAHRETPADPAARARVRGPQERQELGMQLTYMYLTLGRLDQAQEAATWMPAGPLQIQGLASVVSQRGDRARLREFLSNRRPEETRFVPMLMIEAGLMPRGSVLPHPLARGLLAIEDDRPDEAISLLESATERLHAHRWPLPWLKGARRLAEVWERKGNIPRAIQTLERASQWPRADMTLVWSSGSEWLLMRAKLADLYRQGSRLADADRIEADLRTLLAAADPAHPLKR